jgi:DNA-binding MarR family transcriptional regulator
MSNTPSDPALRPAGCTNFKLRQLGRLVARHYEAHLAPAGLKGTQYSLLSGVVKLGPLRSGALAAAMELDASTLTRNLQPLVDRGWVRVRAADDDARSRIIEATASGRAQRERAQRLWKQAQLALNQRLGEARVTALHALLDACAAELAPPQAGRARPSARSSPGVASSP